MKTAPFARQWKAFREFWHRLTTPSSAITDPQERYIARLLALTSAGILGGIALPLIVFLTFCSVLDPIRYYLYATFLLTALAYGLSRTRYYRVGVYVLLLTNSLGSSIIAMFIPNIPFSTYALLMGWNIGALIIGAALLRRTSYLLLVGINLLALSIPALAKRIPAQWSFNTSLVLLAEAIVLLGLAGAYRRHAEELAQSEQRFRDLFESTLDALVIHDGKRILAVNPAFEKMFRCTAEEAIGKNPLHFVAPEAREEAFKLSSEALELPQTLIRSVAQRNDGTSFAAEARVAPVTYEGRQVFAISVRDISKRLEIERALGEERDLLKEILEAIADPFYVVNTEDCCVITANKAAQAQQTISKPRSGLAMLKKSKNCKEIPEECPIREVVERGEAVTIERAYMRARDGKTEMRYAEIHAYPVKDAQGNIRRVIVYAPDITARKRAEAEVRKLSRALEHSAHGIVITNTKGVIEYVNPAFTKMTGYTAEEAIGKTPKILKSGQHPPEFYRDLWRTITSGEIWQGEIINRRKDGTLYWESQTIAPVFDEDGNTTHYIAVKRDISERKRTEEQIRKFQRAVEQAAHSVIITDRLGTIEYANPAFSRVTGYDLEEVIGQNPRILKSGKHPRSFYQNLWNTILKGNVWHGEFVNRRKDGTLYWERASIAPVKDEQGNITHFVAVKENITKQKEMEEELQRARDEALQASNLKTQLLGNVSHDMRTPLGGILGYSEMLLEGAFGELTEKQRTAMLRILRSTQQLVDFTNDLLNQAELESGQLRLNIQLFRPRELLKAIPASEVIAETKGVRVHTEIDPQLPRYVYGDPYWLRQILANLLSNAAKFTDEGHIWVRLLALKDNRWAIQVEDTGPGIPAAAQKHIFEPFRQVDGSPTRRHRGSGLGLSIVKQLVDLMHGEIQVESTVGKGSKFTVILPCQANIEEQIT